MLLQGQKAFNHLLHHRHAENSAKQTGTLVGIFLKSSLKHSPWASFIFFNFSVFFPYAKLIEKGKLTVLNLTILPSLSPSVVITFLLSQASQDPFPLESLWEPFRFHSCFSEKENRSGREMRSSWVVEWGAAG